MLNISNYKENTKIGQIINNLFFYFLFSSCTLLKNKIKLNKIFILKNFKAYFFLELHDQQKL